MRRCCGGLAAPMHAARRRPAILLSFCLGGTPLTPPAHMPRFCRCCSGLKVIFFHLHTMQKRHRNIPILNGWFLAGVVSASVTFLRSYFSMVWIPRLGGPWDFVPLDSGILNLRRVSAFFLLLMGGICLAGSGCSIWPGTRHLPTVLISLLHSRHSTPYKALSNHKHSLSPPEFM